MTYREVPKMHCHQVDVVSFLYVGSLTPTLPVWEQDPPRDGDLPDNEGRCTIKEMHVGE